MLPHSFARSTVGRGDPEHTVRSSSRSDASFMREAMLKRSDSAEARAASAADTARFRAPAEADAHALIPDGDGSWPAQAGEPHDRATALLERLRDLGRPACATLGSRARRDVGTMREQIWFDPRRLQRNPRGIPTATAGQGHPSRVEFATRANFFGARFFLALALHRRKYPEIFDYGQRPCCAAQVPRRQPPRMRPCTQFGERQVKLAGRPANMKDRSRQRPSPNVAANGYFDVGAPLSNRTTWAYAKQMREKGMFVSDQLAE